MSVLLETTNLPSSELTAPLHAMRARVSETNRKSTLFIKSRHVFLEKSEYLSKSQGNPQVREVHSSYFLFCTKVIDCSYLPCGLRGTSSTPNQYSFCLFTRRFFVFVCPLIPANSIESLLPGRAKPKTGLARQHDIIVCRWQSHRTVNLGPSNECLVTFYRETARLIPVLKTWLLSNAKETINDFGDCQTFRAKGKRYKNPRHGGRETARD